MKKYKDQTFLEYTIKIRRVREVRGEKNDREYTDKFYLVDIDEGHGRKIAFGAPIKKNIGSALRKVFREIQKSLYL